jgi:cytochrome b subunit of formate dehydrogenase
MIGTALLHMHYLFLTSRGRRELRALLPTVQDVKDLINNIRYHTWRTENEVKFGQYDYSQKAEYWALIWGTIIMILTGLILWFPAISVRFFPAMVIPASQTIHFYEAILATLAIIVWHFFFVIFHPEEYPMSWTWLTGKMSKASARRHHARWYEEEIATTTEAVAEDLGIRASSAAFTLETGAPEASDSTEEPEES